MKKRYIYILAFVISQAILISLIIIGFITLLGIEGFKVIGLCLCIIGLPTNLVCWWVMIFSEDEITKIIKQENKT